MRVRTTRVLLSGRCKPFIRDSSRISATVEITTSVTARIAVRACADPAGRARRIARHVTSEPSRDRVRRVRNLMRLVLPTLLVACGGAGESVTEPDPIRPTARPLTVSAASADFQVARVSARVTAPPAVLVQDSAGNPIPDVEVTFTVSAGGGTLTGSVTKTNAAGVAAVAAWALGPAPGENRVGANAGSLPPVTFAAIATMPADGATDPSVGFVLYRGAVPRAVDVSYTDRWGEQTLTAHSGQVLLLFARGVEESAAVSRISTSKATVIAQGPFGGRYLVAVREGTESAFIADMLADSRVASAIPHMVTTYAASTIRFSDLWELAATATESAGATAFILDDCNGVHGLAVIDVFISAGGVINPAEHCLDDGEGSPVFANTLLLLGNVIAATRANSVAASSSRTATRPATMPAIRHSTAVLTISSNPYLRELARMERRQHEVMNIFTREMLCTMTWALKSTAEKVVVSVMPHSGLPGYTYEDLRRREPGCTPALRDNVLVVARRESGSNERFPDPDVAYVADASGPGGANGTSFATARASALVQKLTRSGITPGDALRAAKNAVAANARSDLVEAEAVAQADAAVLANLRGTYTLHTINGAPLPGPRGSGAGTRTVAVLAGSLTIGNGTFTTMLSVRDGASASPRGEQCSGVYTTRMQPGAITIDLSAAPPCDHRYSATWDRLNTITATWDPGTTAAFRR